MGRDFHPSQRSSRAGDPHGEDVVTSPPGRLHSRTNENFPRKEESLTNTIFGHFCLRHPQRAGRIRKKRKNHSPDRRNHGKESIDRTDGFVVKCTRERMPFLRLLFSHPGRTNGLAIRSFGSEAPGKQMFPPQEPYEPKSS